MPIKDVFLPLVGQPSGPALAAIEKCVAVAADLGAKVTALAFEENAFERPMVGFPGESDLGGTQEDGALHELLNVFSSAVSRTNIRANSRKAKIPSDQIASVLAEHARFGDLTLLPVKPHDGQTEKIIEALLFESGRPILLCPEERVDGLRPELENVMIAWDHSSRAARAVGDALSILQAATSVHVVTVADDKTDAITQSALTLVHHLREHGIHAAFQTVKGNGSSTGKVLGSWAQSHAIDAIVMGAYHHSRLKEIVWGGATKTVIGQPPCWVMISH